MTTRQLKNIFASLTVSLSVLFAYPAYSATSSSLVFFTWLNEAYDQLSSFGDVFSHGLSIFAEEPFVINDTVFHRVDEETLALTASPLAPLSPDPMVDFSLGDLFGYDSLKSLQAVNKFQIAFDTYEHSVEVRESELAALDPLRVQFKREFESVDNFAKRVEPLFNEIPMVLKPFFSKLPFWSLEADSLLKKMANRNDLLEAHIRTGTKQLSTAKSRLSELKLWHDTTANWRTILVAKITATEWKARFDQIYNVIHAQVGNTANDSVQQQLAALLTEMTATNSTVMAEAEKLRKDAEDRRSYDTGPNLLSFLSVLVSLGAIGESSQSSGDVPDISLKTQNQPKDFYTRPLPQQPPLCRDPGDSGHWHVCP